MYQGMYGSRKACNPRVISLHFGQMNVEAHVNMRLNLIQCQYLTSCKFRGEGIDRITYRYQNLNSKPRNIKHLG